MVDPGDISNVFTKFFDSRVMSMTIKYTGYILLVVLILAIFVFIYYFFQFKYKVTYPVLYYDSNGQNAQILRYKRDRARIYKKSGARRGMLLWKRKIIEPFSDDMIMPGNRINLLRINNDGTWTPMPSLSFQSPGQFEYLTPQENLWGLLELKESATANQTPEATKRILTYTLIAVAFCLIAGVAAVWLIMKAPNKAVEAVSKVTPVLQNIGQSIAGTPPT